MHCTIQLSLTVNCYPTGSPITGRERRTIRPTWSPQIDIVTDANEDIGILSNFSRFSSP
jgi:hypothetical protein